MGWEQYIYVGSSILFCRNFVESQLLLVDSLLAPTADPPTPPVLLIEDDQKEGGLIEHPLPQIEGSRSI